ncbi:MAG: 16S rRNA (guanine(527)-N(7))-methyltransferase RsmG [Bacilli bacterium]|jgi:16S rRNA (guanine527-N7)-methyltransferase
MVNYLNDFHLTDEMKKQFEIYTSFLIEENKKINLTAITKEDEIYIKHFYDSIIVSKYIDFSISLKVADIGTGAGFPGIPLKIIYPNLKLYLIEPTLKRCLFLERLVEALNLKDVYIINKRAEDLNNKEEFDIALARAVSHLNILLEITIPFLKVNGLFIALKGSNIDSEIKEINNALKVLNCTLRETIKYDLPLEMGKRSLVFIKKTKTTDKLYPRKFSMIKKKTL